MKASKHLVSGFLILSALGAAGCSQPIQPTAYSRVSESDAQADMDARLARTHEVRIQLDAIRKALKPVEALLKDLGKAVDLKVEERPGYALTGILDKLENAIREASRGLAQRQEDGSWVIERPSPMALLAGQQGACARSRVRVTGTQIDDGQNLVIAMSDCTHPEQFETLASVFARMNGDREIEISAASFTGLHSGTINLHPCKLVIDKNEFAQMSCDPMAIYSRDMAFMIERLEFNDSPLGVSGEIFATLEHWERGRLGSARARFEPNRPVEFRVCTRSSPCLE